MRRVLPLLLLAILASCDTPKRQPAVVDSTPSIDSLTDSAPTVYLEIPDDPTAVDDRSGIVQPGNRLSRSLMALGPDTTPILDTVWRFTDSVMTWRYTDSAQFLDTIGWNFPPPLPPPPPPVDTTVPPVPPPTGLPPGYSLIGAHTFSAKIESGFTDRGDPAFSIFADPSRGAVGRATYRAGFGGGRGPVLVNRKVPRSPGLWVSFWFRLSPNWQSHPSGVNKLFHLWIGDGGKVGNKMYLSCQGGALQAQVRLQGMAEVPISRNLHGSQSCKRGQWQRWDLVSTANTQGQPNGTVQWWIDGKPAGLYTNLRFTTGSPTWDLVSWNPTWGGVGGTVTATMQMDVDEITVGVH